MRNESPEIETTVLRSAPPASPVARQIPNIREQNFPSIALPNGSHKTGRFAKCFNRPGERCRLVFLPLPLGRGSRRGALRSFCRLPTKPLPSYPAVTYHARAWPDGCFAMMHEDIYELCPFKHPF